MYFGVLCFISIVHNTSAINYQCSVCPIGQYKSATSNNQCLSCPPDTYQDTLGATSITQCMPCPANSYAPAGSGRIADCLCGPGYVSLPNATAGGCDACPPGTYNSESGREACTNCAAGKYGTEPAATAQSMCLDCPANTFSLNGSNLLTNCSCNAGHSGAADGAECVACLAGTYKTGVGIGACTNCSANEYSTTVAQVVSTCTSCPSFSQSPEGSDAATDCRCNAGYTGADGGMCLGCVQGTYKTAIGPSACILCGNNTYSSAEAATSSEVCTACQSNATSRMGSTRQSDCHCLVGFITRNLGAANETCEVCSAGSYNAQLKATTCSKCGAGFQSSTPGAVSSEQCVACPNNTFSAAGAAQCEMCPINTFAPGLSDELSDCKCLAGYHSQAPGQDGLPCSACQPGKHKAQTGAVACTDCRVNQYSTAAAATSNATCLPCTANSVSPAGSGASSMCLCNFGYKESCGTAKVNLARLPGVTATASSTSAETGGLKQSDGSWLQLPLFNPQNIINGLVTPGKYDNPFEARAATGWQSVENIVAGTSSSNWIRLDLQQRTNTTEVVLYWREVTDFYRDALGWQYDMMMFNLRLQVGDIDSPNANPDCATGINSNRPINLNSLLNMTVSFSRVTCSSRGRFVYLVQPAGVRLMQLAEMEVYGDPVYSCTCSACTPGTFKNTLGSASCTNCPANTYSGLTAQASSATCTPCYDNSISPPGSDSIDDCSCSAGFEFS